MVVNDDTVSRTLALLALLALIAGAVLAFVLPFGIDQKHEKFVVFAGLIAQVGGLAMIMAATSQRIGMFVLWVGLGTMVFLGTLTGVVLFH